MCFKGFSAKLYRLFQLPAIVLICLLAISPLNAGLVAYAQTSVSDAPYLYYFSQSEHAIVIERADGSDRRVLARDLMPPDHNAGDLAWSPSGHWLAWRSWHEDGYQAYGQLAWIISGNGKTRLTLLDGLTGIEFMSWSPKSDWLAVSRQTDPRSGEFDLYLIDVEHNRIVSTYQGSDSGHALGAVWTPDGTRVIFSRFGDNAVTTLSTNGRTTRDSMNEALYDTDSCQTSLSTDLPYIPYWGNDHRLANFSTSLKQLVIEGDRADQNFSIDAPSDGLSVHDIRWSPNGDYALIFGQPACHQPKDKTSSLWLLSFQDHSLRLISTNVVYPYDGAVYGDRIYGLFPDETAFPWSPAGDKAFFATGDQQLHILTLPSLHEDKISIPDLKPDRWMASWQLDSKGILIQLNSGVNQPPLPIFEPFYLYSLTDSRLLPESGDNNYYMDIAPRSADGQFLGYECEMWTDSFDTPTQGCILNSKTGHSIKLRPLKVEINDPSDIFWKAFFSWHPTQDWELFAATITATYDDYYYAVVNADGSIQRDLGEGSSLWNAANWLPPQVHLENAVSEPEQAIF